MRFLLFTLYAPMGSLGEVAIGERRMGWARPGRSAILGLVGAALGHDRIDEEAHHALETGLHYAVRTDTPGRPFIDYHTAQTPKARKNRTFARRKEELEAEDLHTVLSVREWRTDAFFTIALWLRQDGTVDLDRMAEALRRPRFTLYLGRKSGTLGLPLSPAIIDADTFMDALADRRPNDEERTVLESIGAAEQPEVAFDYDAPDAPAEARIVTRRDAVMNRGRWQFTDRAEGIISLEGNGE